MRKLKLFFACLLMAVLSIGQVWATDPVLSADFTAKTAGSSSYKSEWTYGDFTIVNAANNNKGWAYMKFGGKSADISTYNPCYVVSPKVTVAISSIDVITNAGNLTKGSVNSWGVYVYSDADLTVEIDHVTGGTMTAQTAETLTLTPSNSATSWPKDSYYKVYFDLANTTTTNGVVWVDKINWYEYEDTPSPSVSVNPSSWNFGTVHASDAASKVFSVSGSNLTAGDLTLSVPTGFSVSPSSIAVDGTLDATEVTVSKNTSTVNSYAGNLSITGGGLASAKEVALTMAVDADPEPTGTFEPFSGDIEEGDYLIVADGAGMNTTVSSNRLQYTALTLTGENYVNPDESVIWHIAESATVGYWTIYNGAESKYAAATGSNNQAQMLESGTDNKSLWGITHSEAVYTITNKSNSRFLKKNGTYGFACYADGTVSLYKKQVEGQPKAPTFSIPGGNYETAQSVELSCETEDVTIHYTLDGTTPTNASPVYSTALAISSTTTIKAIAIKNDVSSTVASATYTIIVWQTVADVWDDITTEGPLNAHIYGYVSQTNVSGYANNFYISDNGSTEGNQLYAYRMDMNSFTVAVGDKVKLAGDLTIHNEVKEFKYTNAENCGKVIALEAKGALQSVAVSGTPIKTEYAANEDFDPTGLKVMGTYANGFVGEITEGITWSNDLSGGKVTESTTVHVTATVSEIASSAYDVAVTVAAKTLVSIALSYDAVEVYQGLELPKPTVTATYSEGDPEDVTAQAIFTGYDASTTGDQEITVTYTFGGHDETANYTVTVNPIFNVELAASVARNLIVNVVGNTESTDDMIVRGKVSYINNASSNAQTYWISDDGTRTNEVEIFKGKYLSGADFTSANQLRVGDEVVVIGKVINYNNSTPEFANGKSEVQSHVRTPNFAITDVTALEVGATDLAVADLTITVEGEGTISFASSDNTDAVTIVDGKLHAVATGTAEITANLAADGIYKAATATFNVTVIAAQVKYAISFDGNGADGGSAPVIADKAAGVSVDLPANSFTYAGHLFAGWKVFNDDTSEEIEVNAGAFEMPASTVTIQAQWVVGSAVTFIAGTDKSDETSITKDGITISATTFNNDSYYQCYSGDAMTVSSAVGNIIKIELTCTAEGTAKYGPGNWDFTGYSYSGSNGSWEGSAETVEFGNAGQQVRMTQIVVYYSPDSREAAGLAWNPADDIELTVGDAFTAPTLQNPKSIDASEITIASNNTDLATVSAGVVSLVANATGTATITATFEGNASYKPATISYTITVSEPNVTFDSSVDHAESGELTISKGGFTLSFTSGSLDEGTAEYRLYKSNTMTLSSTDYLIKKIEFTCTSGNPISGFADATGLDKDNNEWTGESNTVELTASNAQVRMTKIKVFYVEDTRAAAGLAWNPAEDITLTVGDALSAPALLNPNSIDAAEITIASSNTDLATVSEGVVSLVADATGSTTITATFAGNATYKPATVSYKITVNPAHSIYVEPSLNVNFGSVTKDEVVADKSITVTLTGVDAATLTLAGDGASAFTISPAAALTASGDITISASSATAGTFAATLTISDDAGNAPSKVVNLSITVNEPSDEETPVSTTSKWVPATEIVDGMQVLITGVKDEVVYAMGAQANNGTGNNRLAVAGTLEEGVFTPGEGTMAFTLVDQGDDTYAIRTSNGKYLYAAASNANQLKTQDEVNENAKWTMTVASAEAEGSSNRHIMRFNTGSVIFSCYASGQTAIALYVEQSPEPPTPSYVDIRTDLTAGNYYTVCWPKAMTAIKGGTLWSFAGKDDNNAYLIQADAPFVAGRPYIIYATSTKLEAVVEGDDATAGSYNGLHGTLGYMDADDLDAAGATYMLYQNELRPIVYANNNHLAANRAYVILSEIIGGKPANVPAHKVRSMPMQKDAAQGFENLQSGDAPVKVMIEGTMYILRGEKVYDATGRLVK